MDCINIYKVDSIKHNGKIFIHDMLQKYLGEIGRLHKNGRQHAIHF